MGWVLAWQNIIFLVPLAFGCSLVLGAALGLGAEGSHDLHVHSTGEPGAASFLSFLGLGRVPVALLLMILAFLFGVVGLACNELLHEALPATYGLISIGVATAASLLGSGAVARLISRVLPMTESSNVRKSDLVGLSGDALFEIGAAQSGFVQVKDHEGNLMQVQCRLQSGTARKGSKLILLDYDPATDVFTAEQDPGEDRPSRIESGGETSAMGTKVVPPERER